MFHLYGKLVHGRQSLVNLGVEEVFMVMSWMMGDENAT
jgi:hypothetical protein